MKKKLTTIFFLTTLLLTICFVPNCFALEGNDIITFEDTNLKNYFIQGKVWDSRYYDKNGDGEISVDEMSQITSIEISTAPTDWEPLKYATSLESITIYDILVVDFFNIEILANLENFSNLCLRNNGLVDVSALNKLTNLKNLAIYDNKELTDISTLKDLKNLKGLFINNTSITDVSIISDFVNLESMDLQYNKITKIPDLSKIPAFNRKSEYGREPSDSLLLSNNEITDISGIENTGFTSIYLHNNNISDISIIQTMPNIKEIYIYDNNISEISTLPTTIIYIDASYNNIEGILTLSNLENLQRLLLSNNKIEEVSIENLPELQYIALNNNNISDISFLEGLTEIETLDLSTNPISDISPISRTMACWIYLIDTLVNPYDEATFHVMCTLQEYGKYVHLGDCSQFEPSNKPQTGTDELGFTYELNSKKTGYKITKFENTEIKDLNVPSEYNDLPVVELAESLFACKTNLVNVILPDNITSLPMNLFQQCWNLKSVTLPENSTSITIYPNAFAGCDALEKLVVFSNIEEIISGKATVTLNGETREIEWKGFYPSEFTCSEDFAVHGYLDSYAKEYADASEYKFVAIDAYTTEKTEEVTVGEEKVTVMPTEKKTTVEEILTASNFPVIDTYTIKVLDANGNEKESNAKVGSRNVIQITDEEGQVLAEYMVVVPGDVNGDGETKIYDSFQILKDVLVSLSESIDAIEVLIRDFNEDGNVRIYDAFQYLKEAILSK